MSDYYTGNGDDGYTNLIGLNRIPKDNPLIDAIGELDMLNSILGVVKIYVEDSNKDIIYRLQNDLFRIGAELAIRNKSNMKTNRISKEDTDYIERQIDELSKDLPKLTKFVLPGGCEASAYLHLARAYARTLERKLVRLYNSSIIDNKSILSYINRLSSLLFVMALYENYKRGITESNPSY
ncbi:MAG: ATP--cob(I)alamin adenosyltransferase [Candidatus Micrarchaeota archaeon]|nr:MAG: ATP--cob(I)alamin adenosyltransferase [Candidatus Micrarchaeota archaeon]